MSSSTSTQPNGETTALAPTLASVSEQVSAKASQLKNSVTDLGRKAAATIDDNLDVVADSLDSAAYAVYENAANLPGGKTSSRIANAAANRMGATADYLRDNSVKAMICDIRDQVRNNPVPILIAAIAIGVLIGRASRARD